MHVFVNPFCAYGKGWRRWNLIEPVLKRRFGNFNLDTASSPEEMRDQVQAAVDSGENHFIACGGDGTVNLVANVLLNQESCRYRFILGAVGLGSSNDYHKPFDPNRMIRGIPHKTAAGKTIISDVIRAEYRTDFGRWEERFALNNGGIGITAEANALFNRRPFPVRMIKKFSIDGAIAAAALTTVLKFGGLGARIKPGSRPEFECELTNLGVYYNPHFAGSLCYQDDRSNADGTMGIFLCRNLNRAQAVSALIGLYLGRIRFSDRIITWRDKVLTVKADRKFYLELDGEVIPADRVKFQLIPHALRCCR